MSEQSTALTLDERRLKLEEGRLELDFRRLDAERRATRTPEEVALENEQRLATALADSAFLPESVGNTPKGRVAGAWGVIRFARLLNVDPFVLAGQIYVVHGRVGFSTAFLIALVNARGGLARALDWTVQGAAPPNLTVTCTATGPDGIERSASMTWAEVERWGWARKGEPWKADPALMMRYRTAAKLIRLYFGGVLAGLTMTAEELRDLAPDAPEVRGAPRIALPASAPVAQIAPPPLDLEPTPEEQERIRAEERAEERGAK